jgi:iron complex transport system substrate-binding protein
MSSKRCRSIVRTRSSWLAVVALCALLVGACGGSDDAAPAATDPTSSAAPATDAPLVTTPATDSPVVTEAPTTTAGPITTAAPTTTISTRPHRVEHAMGSTEVPGEPLRVVVLDSSFLDAAIALGLPPVGATEGVVGRGLPAYLPADVVASIELVGDTTNPNLEVIAAMQPDLIIGAKVRHEALYQSLSQIAPTVFSESSGTNWTDQVRLTAEALNRVDQGEQLLNDFAARATAVGQTIGADGLTATVVRFLPDQTRLYGPETFSGSVLTAVGFDLGDKGFDPNYSMAIISLEQVALVDADVLFTTTYADEGSARPEFEGLWGTLQAVQNGHQFDIADDTWMTGIGVIGANLILDDLEAWLAPA